MSKEPGKRSQQQNDFLEPGTPINVVATNVGTDRPFNDGAASISFEIPAGSPPVDLYTVTVYRGATAQDATATNTTGTSSPIVVGGLDSNVQYRFTISASNTSGATPESDSTPLILITTVPATPGAPAIQNFSNDQNDYLSWSHPTNGGTVLLTYFWESNDSKSGSVAYNGTTAVVPQEGGTQQQYRLRVTNANGTSEFSAFSVVAFTPPFFPPFFPFFPPFFPFFPFFPPSFPFFPFFPPAFPFFPFFPPRFPFFPFFPPRFPFFPFFPPRFPFFPNFPRFPFFPPRFKSRCLAAETPLFSVDGTWIFADKAKVGDKLMTISGAHIDMQKLVDTKLSAKLPEHVELVETEIVSIEVKTSVLVGFNVSRITEKRYSVTQPILVEIATGLTYVNAGDVKLGDVLIGVLEDGRVTRTTVESIELDDVESEVFDIRTSPLPWFLAENFIVIA
jgi:hypothetical protein